MIFVRMWGSFESMYSIIVFFWTNGICKHVSTTSTRIMFVDYKGGYELKLHLWNIL